MSPGRKPATKAKAIEQYKAHKDRAAKRQRAQSEAGREIGKLPRVKNPARKLKASRNFRFFCEQYFPLRFSIAWSGDHLKAIAKIEYAVLKGGQFALAMPRGSGKTALCVAACIWAVLYGHRKFIALIGADEQSAMDMLESIKAEIEQNRLLQDDFPEACYPIAALEGILNRCPSQIHQGKRTQITWTSKEVVFPTIARARSSQAIIRTRGITGRIRGMQGQIAGRPARPDLVVVDDPQTDESAKSAEQSNDRVEMLMGTVLGLAGPKKKIAAFVPCTVIEPGDMAEQVLTTPTFQGERCKMLRSMPTNMDWWDNYARLRDEEINAGGDGSKATAMYAAEREVADAGAEASWPERFNDDELSAIQNAMNLYYLNRAKFFSEYQNDPQAKTKTNDLTAAEIATRANGLPRGVVPLEATTITAYVDVQGALLYWMVCAWRKSDFTGWVLDWGTWPGQGRDYFSLSDARPTIAEATGISTLEASLLAALSSLVDAAGDVGGLLAREWQREDGGPVRIDLLGADANWGQSTETVYSWARRSPATQLIVPGHGRYVGASSKPLNDYSRKPGDLLGPEWRIPADAGRYGKRHLIYDSNAWKSAVYSRLACPVGAPGGLSFAGRPGDRAHSLLVDHLVAEYRVRTSGRGREVDEWKLRPERPDNHWLDCVVGCAVLASVCGVQVPGVTRPTPPKKKKRASVSYL